MSYNRPQVPRFDRFSVAMIAAMVGSILLLAFGPSFDSGYVTIGALLVFPFALGALVTQAGDFFSWLGCLATPVVLGIAAFGLVYAGIEGMVCVAMVMPVWIVAALGGGLASYWLKRTGESDGEADPTSNRLNSVGLAIVPFLLIYAETTIPPEWETYRVERSVTLDASPEVVWPLLVSIPAIGRDEGKATLTHDWLGIPRPQDARIVRRDGQLVRLASWGKEIRFEERIDTIEPNRKLGWRFAFPDNSVSRHTDRHISPDGPVLKIASGEYRLTDLGNGRTRITLTTRFATRTRFDWYLGWWGEKLLGDVQENVLQIIAQRAG